MGEAPPDPQAVARAMEEAGARLIVRGWLSANAVVFRAGATGATVVDTGYLSHAEQTVALVAKALDGAPLVQVVNTHLHSDHCGGNAALLRRWPDATLHVPRGYRDRLEPWDDARLTYRLTGQRCEVFRPDAYFGAGDQVALGSRRWEVHAAPGHDPEAVVFFQPEAGVLISGDALWERKLAIIFPELAGEDGFGPAHQALDTIERLAPKVVLPGHGPAFSDVATALRASRERIDAFAAAPQRHRRHSARALVVYHLLEHRTRGYEDLLRWIASTPIFLQALQCGHDRASALEAAAETVAGLLADRILCASGEVIHLPSD